MQPAFSPLVSRKGIRSVERSSTLRLQVSDSAVSSSPELSRSPLVPSSASEVKDSRSFFRRKSKKKLKLKLNAGRSENAHRWTDKGSPMLAAALQRKSLYHAHEMSEQEDIDSAYDSAYESDDVQCVGRSRKGSSNQECGFTSKNEKVIKVFAHLETIRHERLARDRKRPGSPAPRGSYSSTSSSVNSLDDFEISELSDKTIGLPAYSTHAPLPPSNAFTPLPKHADNLSIAANSCSGSESRSTTLGSNFLSPQSSYSTSDCIEESAVAAIGAYLFENKTSRRRKVRGGFASAWMSD